MPELPDVETFKRYLDATSLRNAIDRVAIPAPEMLEEISTTGLKRRLKGHRLEHSRRHGKYLFAELDDGDWLVIHFGMTGYLRHTAADEAPPDHTRMLIDFHDGTHLAYVDQRKFGRLTMTDDVAAFVQRQHLGPDALGLDFKGFRALAGQHQGNIKAWLMNQEILAGIGNIYSDEILFQARIHPKRKLEDLSDRELRHLFDKMKEVLKTTIGAHADPAQMPAHYLIPHRKKGARCPVCAGAVTQVKVSGRSSYYCPSCQKTD